MADHLFDPFIVRALIGAPPAPLTLAVDRDLANPLLDMDDATKVESGPDGAIVRIGKTLPSSTPSTPAYSARPRLLAEAIDAGGGGLSEGVQRLADRGEARTLDITGLPGSTSTIRRLWPRRRRCSRPDRRQRWQRAVFSGSATSWRGRSFLYALALAVGAALLEWLKFRHATQPVSTEIYIALLAIGFIALGLWAGRKLTPRPAPAVPPQ